MNKTVENRRARFVAQRAAIIAKAEERLKPIEAEIEKCDKILEILGTEGVDAALAAQNQSAATSEIEAQPVAEETAEASDESEPAAESKPAQNAAAAASEDPPSFLKRKA